MGGSWVAARVWCVASLLASALPLARAPSPPLGQGALQDGPDFSVRKALSEEAGMPLPPLDLLSSFPDDADAHNAAVAFRRAVWGWMGPSDEQGGGRCTVDNVPCVSPCVVTSQASPQLEGFCLTSLSTAGECKGVGESCFVVEADKECPPSMVVGDDGSVVRPRCPHQEGDGEFKNVLMSTSLHLPLFPSIVQDFYSSLPLSSTPKAPPPHRPSLNGPKVRVVVECVAAALGVTPQDVWLTLVLPQEEGIAVSFGVLVVEAARVTEVRKALQRQVESEDGEGLCTVCGAMGFPGLVGAKLKVLQPVTLTYGVPPNSVRVDRFTLSPPHVPQTEARPVTSLDTEGAIRVFLGTTNAPIDEKHTLRVLSSQDSNKNKEEMFAVFSQECRPRGEHDSHGLQYAACPSHQPLLHARVEFTPISLRTTQLTIHLDPKDVAAVQAVCGVEPCLLQVPEGLLWDTEGRTNERVLLEESPTLAVDWWTIVEVNPDLEDPRFNPAPALVGVHYALRIKFSLPVDILSFVGRRFAIGERGTPSRFKQVLGDDMKASYVMDHENKLRKDMVLIGVPSLKQSPVVDMIRSIRQSTKKAYLVVAEAGIRDQKGRPINPYGPVLEADNCYDVPFVNPKYKVSTEASEAALGQSEVPVHKCLLWSLDPATESAGCGVKAADQFCRLQGFPKSFFHGAFREVEQGEVTIDGTLRASGVCSSPALQKLHNENCQTFASITCCGDAGPTVPALPPALCVDHPPKFVDALGDSCDSYARQTWKCDLAHEFVAGPHALSASDACCVCGGGDRYGLARPELVAFTISKEQGARLYFSQEVKVKEEGLDKTKVHFMANKRDSLGVPMTDVEAKMLDETTLSLTGPSIDQVLARRPEPPAVPIPFFLWIDSGLLVSATGKQSWGNAEHVVEETPELSFVGFAITHYRPPYPVPFASGEKNTKADDEAESEAASDDSEGGKTGAHNPMEEVLEMTLEFNRPVLAGTLDLGKVSLVDGPIQDFQDPLPLPLTGARVLHSQQPTATVHVVLQRAHPITQLMLQKEEAAVKAVGSSESPPDAFEYVVMEEGAVREGEGEDDVGLQEADADPMAGGKRGGGVIASRAIPLEIAVQDSGGDNAKPAVAGLHVEGIHLAFEDADHKPMSASDLTPTLISTVPVFTLSSPAVFTVKALQVLFAPGPAFVRVLHFADGGWTPFDPGCPANASVPAPRPPVSELSPDELAALGERDGLPSPVKVHVNTPAHAGANVFLVELCERDSRLPVECEYSVVVVVRECGQSAFELPAYLVEGGAAVGVGGNVLLDDGQAKADEFCAAIREQRGKAVCGGDFSKALGRYRTGNSAEWRVAAPLAVHKNTHLWCSGQYAANQVKTCVTGRPESGFECDSRTLQTDNDVPSDNAQWCQQKESDRQSGGQTALDMDPAPECCFVFSSIACDTLRAIDVQLTKPDGTAFALSQPHKPSHKVEGVGTTKPMQDGAEVADEDAAVGQEQPFDPDVFLYAIDKASLDSNEFEVVVGVMGAEEHSADTASLHPPKCLQCDEDSEAALDTVGPRTLAFVTAEFAAGLAARSLDDSNDPDVQDEALAVKPGLNPNPGAGMDTAAALSPNADPTSLQQPAGPGPGEKAVVRVTDLVNVVLVDVVRGGDSVHYAVVLAGHQDHRTSVRRQTFRQSVLTPTGQDASLQRDPVFIDYCLERGKDGTCGKAAADSFCNKMMGNEAVGLQAHAEVFGERAQVERTVDGDGRVCVRHYNKLARAWVRCETFVSVTCSTATVSLG